jgi:hypothetical protein
VVNRVGPLSNSLRIDWRTTVECQTISLVALIRFVISDSKLEGTAHNTRFRMFFGFTASFPGSTQWLCNTHLSYCVPIEDAFAELERG